jgi:predicted Rossmann fold flavoprotein
MTSNPLIPAPARTGSPDKQPRIIVAGGGAAGFFAAISAARTNPLAHVTILEKSSALLAKVRISGGGRCNVTNVCREPRELAKRYPRGGRALIGPLTRFGPDDTIEWFSACGVRLKAEPDGRMFPVSDTSQTIVECLVGEAEKCGIPVFSSRGITDVKSPTPGKFLLRLDNGSTQECDALIWAGGGCRAGTHPVLGLGHTLVPPVPSLFTFQVECPWLRELPGISLDPVHLSVPSVGLQESGPILITHSGLSGPAVLRLSAWGARLLQECGYSFALQINWLPATTTEQVIEEIQERRNSSGGQAVVKAKWPPLPSRLWEQLVRAAGISTETRWSKLDRLAARRLAGQLTQTVLPVRGKSVNKEEFVTCGGIPLPEVDLKTMQSRLVPGLFFAGETLDIDGITGGFNFQAAWTTGWIAGHSAAQSLM